MVLTEFQRGYNGNGQFEDTARLLIEAIKSNLKAQLGLIDLKDTEAIIGIDFVISAFEEANGLMPRVEHWAVFSGQPINEQQVPILTGEMKKWTNVVDGVCNYGGVCKHSRN